MWTCQNVYTLCIILFAEARSFALKLHYFCKISDGQVSSVAMEAKNIIIFEFFVRGICKSDMWNYATIYIYIVHLHLCCKDI